MLLVPQYLKLNNNQRKQLSFFSWIQQGFKKFEINFTKI